MPGILSQKIGINMTIDEPMKHRKSCKSRERSAQTFRMSWLRLYAVMVLWVIVPFLLPALCRLIAGEGGISAVERATATIGLIFELIGAVLMSACYPVRFDTKGISGFDFWGCRRSMDWDEIASVKKTTFMFLPYRIVRSHRTKNALTALWLPQFFTDNQKVQESIALLAPPRCPPLIGLSMNAPTFNDSYGSD